MIQILKRNGDIDEFEKENIWVAVHSASNDSLLGADEDFATEIADLAEQWAKEEHLISSQPLTVEQIQDKVEMLLMESERKDVAKSYILYREQKNKERLVKPKQAGLLSEEFLSRYKHKEPPMTELGKFVYYRTYSRYLPEFGRRENWWETVRRAVEYNCSLLPTTKEEAEELYDNIFHLRQFVAGRTFWIGYTDVTKKNKLSNFNCSGVVLDNFEALSDLFYLLLVGSGCGFRILEEDVEKIPKVRTDIEVINKSYKPVNPELRKENTSIICHDDNSTVTIVVGDSKEGWVQALEHFLEIHYHKFYSDIKRIIFDYDNVRPAGEPLKTFGGKSSGYMSLENMFNKIIRIIKKASVAENSKELKLQTINMLDIANIIAENVVVGGVRRTAEIGLISPTDEECINAKNNLYIQKNGKWEINKEIMHRQLSNNTIVYSKKPTREKLNWHLKKMRYNGEPGLFNLEAAKQRNPYAELINPCGEILLSDRQNCNLSTVNDMAFVKDGKLDREALARNYYLNARVGFRMTAVELELPEWNNKLHRDRLTGVSPTGTKDMMNAIGMTKEEYAELASYLREEVHRGGKDIASENGLQPPLLATTNKPSGTLSLLPTVSPGIHYPYAEYYIRRVRISRNDPLAEAAIQLGWSVKPEVGQEWETCNTVVVEFPVKAPKGKTIKDVTAIEQLEDYKLMMDNYVDHNVSITVTVKEDEWDDVEEWLWNNWDDVVAISFLPASDAFYELMPYEEIDKEKYEEMSNNMAKFSVGLLSKIERHEFEHDIEEDPSCATGACPVR